MPLCQHWEGAVLKLDGARGANRTRDYVIKSHVLCLLSYTRNVLSDFA